MTSQTHRMNIRSERRDLVTYHAGSGSSEESRQHSPTCYLSWIMEPVGGFQMMAVLCRATGTLVAADVRRLRSFPRDRIGQPSPQSFDQSLVTSAATNTATRFH